MLKQNNFIIALCLLFLLFWIIPSVSFANHLSPYPSAAAYNFQSTVSAFRSVLEIKAPSDLTLPTVIELIVSPNDVKTPYVLYDFESNSAVYTLKKQITKKPKITVYLNERYRMASKQLVSTVHDDNLSTDYKIATDGTAKTSTFIYQSDSILSSSGLHVQLANNAREPESVTLYAEGLAFGEKQLVVSKTALQNGWLYFPETTATDWEIEFSHSQPLQIAEMDIVSNTPEQIEQTVLRFLAQPGRTYYLYISPDRAVPSFPYTEYTNLEDPIDSKREMYAPAARANHSYQKADVDSDQVVDERDNCPTVANSDQTDINANGTGDACEDFDYDGILNSNDNCPDNPNGNQTDSDSDSYGDVCDPEESRLTERIWWLPWLGILVGFGVVLMIFATTVRSTKLNK